MYYFSSDDEDLSAKDAPDAGAAVTAVSRTLTAPDASKDAAPSAGTGNVTPVPKKKAKKTNADKGVVIISDNPSGPPLDDVSLHPCAQFHAIIFIEYLVTYSFSCLAADNSRIS